MGQLRVLRDLQQLVTDLPPGGLSSGFCKLAQRFRNVVGGLKLLDLGVLVEAMAEVNSEDGCVIILRGLEQRRQLVLGDEFRF